MSALILLVDDDPAVLDMLRAALEADYRLRIATRGRRAIELAGLDPMPDLILLDVSLPDISGYAVCETLRQIPATAEIPLIFLTSHSNTDDIVRGLELGAVDFVSKPVIAPVVKARVKTHLRLRDQNLHLETLVRERTQELVARTEEVVARSLELQRSQELTIIALGSIAETRDNETGNHIHRTRAYAKELAHRIRARGCYHADWSAEQWSMVWKSAPLHDIGKVGIQDSILLKPGKLSDEEFAVMKRHPAIGRDSLRTAELRTGTEQSFLRTAKEIAYSHHERWDGTGYPEHLAGEDIPLAARIMAVADVYDALISPRVYKRAWSHAEAVAEIARCRGTHFDPLIVDCFLDDPDAFDVIARQFSDEVDEEA